MTVLEYLDANGSLRYLLRDVLKTRYTDEQLLVHLNAAIKQVARDTHYFRGVFELRVMANVNKYTYDSRILEIKSAYINGCNRSILRREFNNCNDMTSESTLDYIYPTSGDTRQLTTYPMLTAPVVPSTDYSGIAIRYIDDSVLEYFGLPMVYEDGVATPIIAELNNYVPVALYCVYVPSLLSLTDSLTDSMIALDEIINVAVQRIVTQGTTTRNGNTLHKNAINDYNMLVKKYKGQQSIKFAGSPLTVKYRLPFGNNTKIDKDF